MAVIAKAVVDRQLDFSLEDDSRETVT